MIKDLIKNVYSQNDVKEKDKKKQKIKLEKFIKTHQYNANDIIDQKTKLTLLMLLCRYGHHDLAKPLIHLESTDHTLKSYSNTAFRFAILNGYKNIIREFRLDGRVNFNGEGDNVPFETLIRAVKSPSHALIDEFFNAENFDINKKNFDDETILMTAVKHNTSINCFRKILTHQQIDINITNHFGVSAYNYAVLYERRLFIEQLLVIPHLITTMADKHSIIRPQIGSKREKILLMLVKFRKFPINWNIQRLLWITILKPQNDCPMSWLPKDVLKEIIKFLNDYKRDGFGNFK